MEEIEMTVHNEIRRSYLRFGYFLLLLKPSEGLVSTT